MLSVSNKRLFVTHVRINLDMLKTRHREELLLAACIAAKQPFVVDNTNPTREDRARYLERARAAGFRVVGYYFESKIDDALRRNAWRAPAERIPDNGVRGTHSRLELPDRKEGFDALYYVRIATDGTFFVEEWRDEV
jgi:predicted kinase